MAMIAVLFLSVTAVAQTAEERMKALPFYLEFENATNAFVIGNLGDCPIYAVKVKTYPPKAHAIQLIFDTSSFVVSLAEPLNPKKRIKVMKKDLIDGDGIRLSDNVVVGNVTMEGSFCGKDIFARQSVR